VVRGEQPVGQSVGEIDLADEWMREECLEDAVAAAAGRVEVLPAREDVADLYAAADVFVFPSLTDTFGITGAFVYDPDNHAVFSFVNGAPAEADRVLAANASRIYVSFRRHDMLGGVDPKRVLLLAEITEKGQRIARNIFWFEKTKDLDLPRPEVALAVAPGPDGTFAITVGAKALARCYLIRRAWERHAPGSPR